jgi:hypothetical protein
MPESTITGNIHFFRIAKPLFGVCGQTVLCGNAVHSGSRMSRKVPSFEAKAPMTVYQVWC